MARAAIARNRRDPEIERAVEIGRWCDRQARQISLRQRPCSIAVVDAGRQDGTRRDIRDGHRSDALQAGNIDIDRQHDRRIFLPLGVRRRNDRGILFRSDGNCHRTRHSSQVDCTRVDIGIGDRDPVGQVERAGVIRGRSQAKTGEIIRCQRPGSVSVVGTGREGSPFRDAGDDDRMNTFAAIRIGHGGIERKSDTVIFRSGSVMSHDDRLVGLRRDTNRQGFRRRRLLAVVLHRDRGDAQDEIVGCVLRRRDRQAVEIFRGQTPRAVRKPYPGGKGRTLRDAADDHGQRLVGIGQHCRDVQGDRRILRPGRIAHRQFGSVGLEALLLAVDVDFKFFPVASIKVEGPEVEHIAGPRIGAHIGIAQQELAEIGDVFLNFRTGVFGSRQFDP